MMSKLIRQFLILWASLTFLACTDSSLEPIDTGGPDSEEPAEEPMGEDPGEEPEISDNPILRLNSGGEEVAYGDTVFTADDFFSGDSMSFNNAEIGDILETDMDSLYVTERNSVAGMGNFEYKIPITNGTYKLKLHFAEIYWGAANGGDGNAGARVFDVDVEEALILDNYDIYDEVGAITAIIKEYIVTVEDEELNIKLTASVDRPKISAIEVLGDGQIINTGN
jgi:hypothetical protein